MRIIKESRVKQFMLDHPKARRMLERWIRLTRQALWTRFGDVRGTFQDADEVRVASGSKAMVFDIHGNDFRLITAVHYMVPDRTQGAQNIKWTGGRVYVFRSVDSRPVRCPDMEGKFMTTQTTRTPAQSSFRRIPRTYAALVALLPLRPIHDAVELHNATEILDAMALHREHFSADQADFFDVLASLVASYESEHDPLLIPKTSPRETLKSLLQSHRMTASDLGRIIGNRELGSKILRGERNLTVNHIKKIARRFRLDPGIFI